MSFIQGDDGLPADEVGDWTQEKHTYLKRYLDISGAARRKYLGPAKGGAAYFDLFCATGRARIRESNQWIDGSAVAAWKTSVGGGAPFSAVFVSDINAEALQACAARLRRLGAPVTAIPATAVEAARKMVASVSGYGLYFAFIDPYSLGALDFRVIRTLAGLKRVDLLIHVSAMDLQRNLGTSLLAEHSTVDTFAPGWREEINTAAPQAEVRRRVVEYWRNQVAGLGVWPSTDQRLIEGARNQPLYWLLLASRHELAHTFWSTAANPEGQRRLF